MRVKQPAGMISGGQVVIQEPTQDPAPGGDPSRGRQTFQTYVLEKWLPHHLLEPGVRYDYEGQIRRRLLPFFGPMKMRDIMPEHVRQWVTQMRAQGASARTIQYCKTSILNAIFTTALDDEVVTNSYAGLYDWAVHHSLAGWQAMSWPAEIDVFLAIGELALYVAYLDGWPARQRVWPWATAITGLSVSVAGNIGHIEPHPGQPVILADRLTAATSPVAAFAGLAIGLLVLKMTRHHALTENAQPAEGTNPAGQPAASGHLPPSDPPRLALAGEPSPEEPDAVRGRPPGGLLQDATLICQAASTAGERLSQRSLARQLRTHGHRFSNQDLHGIAATIGLTTERKAA